MALVILSAGKLAQSKIRTLSLRKALAMAACLLFAVAVGAFALGWGWGWEWGRQTAPAAAPPLGLKLKSPDRSVLIDRVGELSGRLLRLEHEARNLTQRIEVLQDQEEAQNNRVLPAPSAYEGAKPITPAGGPLIPLDGGAARSQDFLSKQRPEAAQQDAQSRQLNALERDLAQLHITLGELARVIDARQLELMTFPSRSPVPGALHTSSFGRRLDPFNRSAAFHSGLDFPAPSGHPIVASAGGRVIYAGYRKDYGYTIEIDHGKSLITRYAHCSRLLVKPGEVVAPGQRIGLVGSSGRSTGPHLHFEVLKNGRYSNPQLYLVQS
jgi:murein DD-endopeptidase MepM/ murein hydrolase activator NlpD